MATRVQTMVQLNEELLGRLDEHATRAGVSRSQVIRDAIDMFLAADREAEIDRQIIDGYRRMPQGGEYDRDDWGDIGRMVDTLTAAQLRELSEEEREAGFEPW